MEEHIWEILLHKTVKNVVEELGIRNVTQISLNMVTLRIPPKNENRKSL